MAFDLYIHRKKMSELSRPPPPKAYVPSRPTEGVERKTSGSGGTCSGYKTTYHLSLTLYIRLRCSQTFLLQILRFLPDHLPSVFPSNRKWSLPPNRLPNLSARREALARLPRQFLTERKLLSLPRRYTFVQGRISRNISLISL